MKREKFLATLALLLSLEGYIANTLAPALLGVGILLYLYGVRSGVEFNIKGERRLRSHSFEEGKPVEAEVSLKNLGERVRVRLIDESPGFEVITPKPFLLEKGEETSLTYTLTPKKRGRLSLLPLRVVVEDERGLYFEEFSIGNELEVNVYPSVDWIKEASRVDYNLRMAEARKNGRMGSESIDLKDLREFLPGDDFKRIDWKATARIGELIVREFLREEDSPVYIVLDNTREMRKGLRKSKVDYGSILALQLATALASKFRVGFVIYDDVSASVLQPARGRAQVELIRRRLQVEGEKGLMSLRFSFEGELGERAGEFLRKVLPLRKGRRGLPGIYEAFSLLREKSYVLLITDLSNPRDVYRVVSMARKKHRIMILSPNPVLFYSGKLDEKTLKRLYSAYVEREKLIERFNALVPTLDLGPSDYIKELSRWGL
ncbi:DUF58 domain-containing protein [Thermococcus sp.]